MISLPFSISLSDYISGGSALVALASLGVACVALKNARSAAADTKELQTENNKTQEDAKNIQGLQLTAGISSKYLDRLSQLQETFEDVKSILSREAFLTIENLYKNFRGIDHSPEIITNYEGLTGLYCQVLDKVYNALGRTRYGKPIDGKNLIEDVLYGSTGYLSDKTIEEITLLESHVKGPDLLSLYAKADPQMAALTTVYLKELPRIESALKLVSRSITEANEEVTTPSLNAIRKIRALGAAFGMLKELDMFLYAGAYSGSSRFHPNLAIYFQYGLIAKYVGDWSVLEEVVNSQWDKEETLARLFSTPGRRIV